MKSVKLFISIALVGIFTLTKGQVPALDWVGTYGGKGFDRVKNSTMDGSGNIYTVGYFNDTADFDPGSAQVVGQPYNGSSGPYTGFVQKLNPQGNLLWVKYFKSSDQSGVRDVQVTPGGSIVICGFFSEDSIDLNPDPTMSFYVHKADLTNNSGQFYVKLNSNGQFVWGSGQTGGIAVKLAIDSIGNIYGAGHYDTPFDTLPGDTATSWVYPATSGVFDGFVQKLDSNGTQQWVRFIRGNGTLRIQSMSLNENQEPLLVGDFSGSIDFNPGPGLVQAINNTSNHRGYLLHLNHNGGYVSYTPLQGSGDSKITEVKVDADGMIYLAGFYDGDVDFDPGPSSTAPTLGKFGWFLGRLNKNKQLDWSHRYEQPYNPNLEYYPLRLLLDSDRNIYFTGHYEGYMNLQPTHSANPIIFQNIGCPKDQTIFLSRHDSSGTLDWGFDMGSCDDDRVMGIMMDQQGSIYLTGTYSGGNTTQVADFDPRSGHSQTPTVAPGEYGYDAFVLKLRNCDNYKDTLLPINACDYYIDSTNGQQYYNDTLVTDTVYSINGCDSLLILDITVSPQPKAWLANSGGVLFWNYQASYSGHSFKWYSCDSDSIIPGETDSAFTPKINGSYALIVERNGCVDTSNCQNYYDADLEEELGKNTVDLYPNPAVGLIHIKDLDERVHIIKLYSLSGELVFQSRARNTIDLSNLPPGVYFMHLQSEGDEKVGKVVKR